MAERAFDRYGRIVGAGGYDYVINKLGEGLSPSEIADKIQESHPQFDRSQIEDYVLGGISAQSQSESLQRAIESESLGEIDIALRQSQIESAYRESVVSNPRLFGIRPEGDRYKYTFEFGETEGIALIKVTITSAEWFEYFEAYRKAYERAIEICMQYPTKFGLENPDDCHFLFSRAYAPEKRW